MSEPTNMPSLTQPQREAIFDFLLLGMYADSTLTAASYGRSIWRLKV